MRNALVAIILFVFFSGPVWAQAPAPPVAPALVVETCGTVVDFPSAGNPAFLVVDVDGNLCSGNATLVAELEEANATLDDIESNTGSTDPVPVLPKGTDTGGQTMYGLTTTASVNTTGITTEPTGVYTIFAFNPTETEAFLFLHNDNTPTCNSATDLAFIMGIPPSPAAGQQGGFLISFTIPITSNFSTALGLCVKGDSSATSNTAAPAGILVGIGYFIEP